MAVLAAVTGAANAQHPGGSRRAPPDAPDGQALIVEAAERLSKESAFQAQTRQRVELFGQRLVGTGIYLQKSSPRGLLLRWELQLQLGAQRTTVQQISDGRFLWIRRVLPEGTVWSRVDLARIRRAAGRREPAPLANPSTNWLLLGGLPGLVAALAHNFQFGSPKPAETGGAKAWALEGVWKREKLQELLPDQKDAIAAGGPIDLARLPAQLPTAVRVVLAQEDLTPYRIEYLRLAGPAATGTGSAQSRTTVVLELSEVRRGGPIDDQLFSCTPGDQPVADHTDLYLQTLGLQ